MSGTSCLARTLYTLHPPSVSCCIVLVKLLDLIAEAMRPLMAEADSEADRESDWAAVAMAVPSLGPCRVEGRIVACRLYGGIEMCVCHMHAPSRIFMQDCNIAASWQDNVSPGFCSFAGKAGVVQGMSCTVAAAAQCFRALQAAFFPTKHWSWHF